ncbi:MAG: hemerythrin domain-containing protein, partial [Deltaproteobacteria bacterium]|nr:hemerythrin domain-containing protein [Deltaproteobacteria bacterium]
EEEVLIPELSARVSECDAVIVLTVADHVVLRRLLRQARSVSAAAAEGLIGEIGRKISEHVRFEEQTLYPALEAALGRERLNELAQELAFGSEGRAVRGAQHEILHGEAGAEIEPETGGGGRRRRAGT